MQESKFGLNHKVTTQMERGRKVGHGIEIAGHFDAEIWRDGKCIHRERLKNGVTNIGKDSVLDYSFRNQTQPTNWYVGIIDTGATEAAADTMASHAGWTYVTTYDEATRPEWVTVAAASQSISNTTTADFTFNATETLYGVFITSVNTKSGATGILWATAAFSSEIPVISGDILKITYTVNAT
ncbi:hypothetical protein KAU11_06620 [Candidatus Babeliales bacterium]|nr:hypothetical protein [Candidatus Babeliales bacterium]